MAGGVVSIADGVWGVEGEVRMPGGIRLPVRSTLISLPGGALWMYSPVHFDDATAAAIGALGPVKHIVVPSLEHTRFVAAAKQRWPGATVWGVAALGAQRPELPLDEVLTETAPPTWGGALEILPIYGAPRLQEIAVVHRPSRSLLVSDLVFNFAPANLRTGLLLRLVGCHGRMASSRSWGWVFAKDRAAVGASVRRILERDFDRVIPCHGDVVQQGGRAELRRAVATLAAWGAEP